MRLNVTDHALVRAADWHPELRQFVPWRNLLDFPQAQGVLNALHVFVASLEGGRPMTYPEDLARQHIMKYGKRPMFILDRPLFDLYSFAYSERGDFALVTVTWLTLEHAEGMVDDPNPPVRFADVDEIRLPYLLDCGIHDDPEFRSLCTPAGREIKISYNVAFTSNLGICFGTSLEEARRRRNRSFRPGAIFQPNARRPGLT